MTVPLTIAAPASKSMTQRALILAALTPGVTRIEAPLVCDDSRHLTELLRALGCTVTWGDDAAVVTGAAFTPPEQPVFCGNAGTAVRFGSCLSLLCNSPLTIDGDAHMRRRPIGELGAALTTMGIHVRYLGAPGCPPLELSRHHDPPAQVTVDTTLSSQYASGLLLVAPRLAAGLALDLDGALVSQPYIAMTAAMMQRAGADVSWVSDHRIVVKGTGYPPVDRIDVEPDWSGAAFVLAAAHLKHLDVTVPHLLSAEHSLQGDAAFPGMMAEIQRGVVELDLTDVPDLIAPLTAVCLFADHPTRLRGAAHTRIKECDRVAVLCRELRKLGARMVEHPDGLDIEPLAAAAAPTDAVRLDPEEDHRMAMTFGLVSLRVPGIEVDNPGCVSKSFPDFWDMLKTIRAQPTKVGDDSPP